MKILDCESIKSTYASLETILGVRDSDLHGLFESLDVRCEQADYEENPPAFLLSYVQQRTCCKTEYDATCWFHVTRVQRNNTFEDGILPLGKIVPRIWGFLFELTYGQLTPEQWTGLQTSIWSSNFDSADLYRTKLLSPEIHGGPYAFLIRDIAFVRKSYYVDYLAIPEIVEDICLYCEHVFKVNLKQRYINNTTPSIIKFLDQKAKAQTLGTALLYAYEKRCDLELSDWCTHSFSGKGRPISKDRILKVEFLDESKKV
jgi:hypothetical protein